MTLDVPDDEEANMYIMMLESKLGAPIENLQKDDEEGEFDIRFEQDLPDCNSDAEAVYAALMFSGRLAENWSIATPLAQPEKGFIFRGSRTSKKSSFKVLPVQNASFFVKKAE